MTNTAWISISCQDRVGLVAEIAGRIFDLGGNLGDTTFSVLGEGAEFTSLCDFPASVAPGAVEAELKTLPELDGAQVSVRHFDLAPVHGPAGQVTHRIAVSGGDRPGLVARLCEVFVQFHANIVRLHAEKIPGPGGGQYVVNMAVNIPPDATQRCLATIANTAGELRLDCHWEAV
ncbi:MAG: amino acid-binding protein [Magnetospirillum sp. WYHS-4]